MDKNKILAKLREDYDCKMADMDFLQNSGGTTYVVNGKEQKFFLKIMGKAFRETFRQSVDIVRYLFGKGFPVPAVIETKSGKPMLEVFDEGQEYLLVLSEYIEGKSLTCVCGEKVGDLTGQLHRLLQWMKSWEERWCTGQRERFHNGAKNSVKAFLHSRCFL